MMLRWLALNALCAPVLAVNGPVVQTDDGPIQGTHPAGDDSVLTYRGIPFAAPPTGALRWKSPQRPTPWTRPLKTDKVDPECPQLDFVKGLAQGHEDCLYATVYVPKQCTATTPCPVMQWIYGGAWIEGSDHAGYDGTKLAAQHSVVVVTRCVHLCPPPPVRDSSSPSTGWPTTRNPHECRQQLPVRYARVDRAARARGGRPKG